jgi:exosortase
MNGASTNPAPPTFWQDTVACWQRLPNKILFFTLLAAWVLLFQFWGNSILGYIHTPSLFAWLREAYGNPDSSSDGSYGNFIPFLVVGLFWWKRQEMLALPLQTWWPGLLILTAASFLHIAGHLLQQPYFSVIALFTGIYGLMGLAWGPAWLRKGFFPFFLFIFSVPLGARAEFITFPLRLLVCWLVEMTGHYVLGINVVRVGTQLFDPSGTYQYEVAAACSGIRSLVAIFLLATVYGFVSFRQLWKKLLLMALAFPFAVLGNLVRMLLIIVAAAMGGQEWGNYVHEGGPLGILSLVPYVPAIFGLLAVGRLLEKRDRAKKSGPEVPP